MERKKLLSCDVFKEELLKMSPPPDMDVEFVAMGLHLHPLKLHQEIQKSLDNTKGYSMVILGFGLCGASLNGIKAPDCPMVIPRVHDCIPILLGSKTRYNELQEKNSKTFYFSGGWVEGDRMIISEYERSCKQFGLKRALRINEMLFENYNRLLYIHSDHPRTSSTLAKTKEFAEVLKLPCMETEGSLKYLEKMLYGPWDNKDFVTIPAHGLINEEDFLEDGMPLHIQGA